MKVDTLQHPAIARRLRLSTAGISTAVIVTCAALLAIVVAVGPSDVEPDSSVSFEAPVVNLQVTPVTLAPSASAPGSLTGGQLQPVALKPGDSALTR